VKSSLFLPFLISIAAGLLLAVVVASGGWGFSALFIVVASVALTLLWTGWIRRDARVLEAAVSEIGAGKSRLAGDGSNTSFRDFDDLAHAIRQASGRVDRSLANAAGSRQELEAMIDSMLDAVIAVDAAGRIQWTNQRVQKLIPGMPFSSTVRVGHALVQTIRDPDLLDCMRIALEQRIVSERRSTSLLPGKIFEIAASPMPGGGAVAVLHDITRIEQVERTQRDFVANVSHELRTPLTSITGYVETLLDHEQGLSPQAREFLTTIHKNATRMNRLTEDLLVMARVESSEQELHPANLRADILVRDAVQAMSGMVQDEEAVLEVGETVSDEVMADQDAAVQVLSNLIENAIKYGRHPAEGCSRVIVSAHSLENFVEFRVQDFGPGIASEHLQRIFERFYRVDKARSRESGGTGLGLAIARHVIESQGGTIRVDSELNAGSTFIFTLPRTALRSV
jgi:two-component system phosphate regulon sensor histidine kinase PhoR